MMRSFVPSKPDTRDRSSRVRPPPKTARKNTAIPEDVVAAIRWDYDDGLMRLADIQAKYAGKVSTAYVSAICYRNARPDVKAKRGTA